MKVCARCSAYSQDSYSVCSQCGAELGAQGDGAIYGRGLGALLSSPIGVRLVIFCLFAIVGLGWFLVEVVTH